MDDEYLSGWEGMWMGRSLVVLKKSFYSFCEQKKWAYQEKTKLGPQNVGAEFWIWNLCSLSGLQTWPLPCPPLTQSLCLTGQLFPSEIGKHSQGSFLTEHKGNIQIQTYFKATVQGGRWEGESGWGTHVNPWLIHVNVWQKPLQYCKVISLQLIKINEEKNK